MPWLSCMQYFVVNQGAYNSTSVPPTTCFVKSTKRALVWTYMSDSVTCERTWVKHYNPFASTMPNQLDEKITYFKCWVSANLTWVDHRSPLGLAACEPWWDNVNFLQGCALCVIHAGYMIKLSFRKEAWNSHCIAKYHNKGYQCLNNGRISQCTCISKAVSLAAHNLPQNTTHDLSGSGHWQTWGADN